MNVKLSILCFYHLRCNLYSALQNRIRTEFKVLKKACLLNLKKIFYVCFMSKYYPISDKTIHAGA